ncbi:DNA mismatch repair protein [Maudiozyma exigua]|uniref:DNA mismatch repair protein HSM3 n=1 Tax=Maudiozyma exigua TaxID=34358 RepID=A0A9P6WE73_MAUEX|nr:DNA mismatch repair protein [Kazachstania exigua]
MTDTTPETPYLSLLLNELSENLSNIIADDDVSDCSYVNKLMERCVLNSSTITKLSEIPNSFLLNVKNFLQQDSYYESFNYEELLQLLDNIITICPFNEITKIYSMEDIQLAMSSNVNYLIRIACKIIRNSQPLDYFVKEQPSQAILYQLMKLYFEKETDIVIASEIEKIFTQLSKDTNFRHFILQQNEHTLLKIKDLSETITTSRLYEFLTIELNFINPEKELSDSLFLFNKSDIYSAVNSDPFQFISTLQYCTSAVKFINYLLKEVSLSEEVTHKTNAKAKYLMDKFAPIIPVFGTIYRENISDVADLSKSYFFKFFRAVSYLPTLSLFRELDSNDILLDHDNNDLLDYLAFVNPQYLYQYCSDLITQFIKVEASYLGIWRNCIQHEKLFYLIKDKMTSKNVLYLPYLEQMVLLDKLSQYDYSTEFLVNSLPSVMTNLINDEDENNLVNPETIELRATVIRNLLKFDETLLGIWYIPLTSELFKINHPGSYNEAKTKIEDTFA